MRALDWLGRTALLVLSGLATIAILLSLQSASTALDDRTAPRRAAAPTSAPDRMIRRPEATADPAQRGKPARDTSRESGVTRQPDSRDGRAIVRWLRALTYAVLALAGFAAAAMLVLMRITAHLARIADR